MTDYHTFRQQLDVVLRTLDVEKVRQFLVDQGHWDEGTPADPEFAMWMMIAGSQTVKDLHPQAKDWLLTHGHSSEAAAVFGTGPSSARKGSQGNGGKKGGRGAPRPVQNKRSGPPPRSQRQK
ncbi:hypothetical protein KDA_08450 [Dictyobacter alpinus]|uniref:Uncharacterized protein n=1 Tax=Dictyobacter alpinus TaxID=2014873 RepID=A0A402B1Y5_9CHLR|nr:hypothetical protein [Dictyobacter alpinus]GCE25361.1 hypothetical protein KDA_08450 [Dictyobacter alpinus]